MYSVNRVFSKSLFIAYYGLPASTMVADAFIFIFFIFILNYLNTKSLQQFQNKTKKNLITIIHYNIYIFTVYLPKTYLDAAALPGSRVFVFFQLLK